MLTVIHLNDTISTVPIVTLDKVSMQHVKAQIYAHMIVQGMSLKDWAEERSYNPNTVSRVLARFGSGKRFRKNNKSEQIINDLLKMIGSETIN